MLVKRVVDSSWLLEKVILEECSGEMPIYSLRQIMDLNSYFSLTAAVAVFEESYYRLLFELLLI